MARFDTVGLLQPPTSELAEAWVDDVPVCKLFRRWVARPRLAPLDTVVGVPNAGAGRLVRTASTSSAATATN